MSEKKYSIEEVKKIAPEVLFQLIERMRKKLKKDEVVKRIFDDYNLDINEIDFIPMAFSDLDVSAKTDHGIIYFNYSLLCDGDFFKDYMYAVHEMTHFAQQTTGDGPTQGADDGDYLDNEFEQEGFQNQLEYMADEFGPEEAEDYVDDLLEHHEINGKKEKKEKKEVLLAKV